MRVDRDLVQLHGKYCFSAGDLL
eukprot:COSAG02_NODE_63617_length_262_cov_2.981595_1_plen_22_part_10